MLRTAGLVLHFFFFVYLLFNFSCIDALLSAIEWCWVQLMEDNKRGTKMILGVDKQLYWVGNNTSPKYLPLYFIIDMCTLQMRNLNLQEEDDIQLQAGYGGASNGSGQQKTNRSVISTRGGTRNSSKQRLERLVVTMSVDLEDRSVRASKGLAREKLMVSCRSVGPPERPLKFFFGRKFEGPPRTSRSLQNHLLASF
jgi:hypothetical protein